MTRLLPCDWKRQEGPAFRVQNGVAVLLWLRHVSREAREKIRDGA